MISALLSFLISTLPVLSFAEIVDFGSLDQYRPHLVGFLASPDRDLFGSD